MLVSIHDVMPHTLGRTERLLELLRERDVGLVTLFVVPGRDWDRRGIDALRRMSEAGAELAGHGWRHRVERIGGIVHRLHSLAISRDVAEHLALSRSETVELVDRCYRWFETVGLPLPSLYIPPAWAMGPLTRRDMRELPFLRYETLTGVFDAATGRFRRLPMVGFEADTPFRALACRLWNRVNLAAAGPSRPLRVAIHPYDLELRLRDDLLSLLEEPIAPLSYDAVGVMAAT